MIYLAVAMGSEAKPIISHFNLKRDNSIKKLQVFKNEKITLIITGTGILKSAISLTHILSKVEINKNDFIFNIGICGSSKAFKIGEIIICNKVVNSVSKKCWYPDMIFSHPFIEGSLESFEVSVHSDELVSTDCVDMEGAGIAEAGSLFFETSQIQFLKIVSDYLDNNVKKENIEKLISESLLKIEKWINKVESSIKYVNIGLTEQELGEIRNFSNKFKFSQTMFNRIRELLNYFKIKGGKIEEILEDFVNCEVKDKKEGKKIFDEIEKRVI